MPGFFFNLGKRIRPTVQKGKWVLKSLGGSEQDGILAEYEVGKEMAALFEADAPIEKQSAAAHIVNRIAGHLSGRMQNKQRTFTFRVVNLPEPNAFALPGGFIFITSALLELCGLRFADPQPPSQHSEIETLPASADVPTTPVPAPLPSPAVDPDSFRMSEIPGQVRDEIAFVLGHEMAHVLRGHAMERMVNSTVVNTATKAIPVGGMMGRLLLGAGSKAMHSAYSQGQELEADELGARIAAAAGYVPGGALTMLRRLKELSAQSDDGLGEYFSTHPPFDLRINALQKLIK